MDLINADFVQQFSENLLEFERQSVMRTNVKSYSKRGRVGERRNRKGCVRKTERESERRIDRRWREKVCMYV